MIWRRYRCTDWGKLCKVAGSLGSHEEAEGGIVVLGAYARLAFKDTADELCL
jgi:hypothetical protein